MIFGFMLIALSVGTIAYMYAKITPDKATAQSSTIVVPPEDFVNDAVIAGLKKLKLPNGIPVDPQSNELSRENPFLKY